MITRVSRSLTFYITYMYLYSYNHFSYSLDSFHSNFPTFMIHNSLFQIKIYCTKLIITNKATNNGKNRVKMILNGIFELGG